MNIKKVKGNIMIYISPANYQSAGEEISPFFKQEVKKHN